MCQGIIHGQVIWGLREAVEAITTSGQLLMNFCCYFIFKISSTAMGLDCISQERGCLHLTAS